MQTAKQCVARMLQFGIFPFSFKIDTGSFQPHPPVVVFAGTCQDLFDKVAVSENAFITGKPDALSEIQRYAHETG